MDFYTTKQNLTKVAAKLFDYKPIDLKGDVDLEGKFDYIKYDIYGVRSFSPSQQMEKENLEYNRDEQGRDFFSSFLTLVIQAGVYLGQQMDKEIEDMKRELENEKKFHNYARDECKKLKRNQMGKGTVEDEVVKLRKELAERDKKIHHLEIYKNGYDRVQQQLDFWK